MVRRGLNFLRLVMVLSFYHILPGLAAAIFQEFQDDAPEMARRQLALLELSQAGANLVEFTHFMSQQLGQDQDVPKSSLTDMTF